MKLIAFYLPQFHRIPENDAWWGASFTEWTNLRRARPLFPGHYQPREPYQDYYYDLTDPAAREWQARVAREYGIYGFCYYHYWFQGKRLLETPFDALLRTGKPDFPFCLCWTNHHWTRCWDGEEHELLMPQHYGDEADWRAHFACLLAAFRDERYIRVDGNLKNYHLVWHHILNRGAASQRKKRIPGAFIDWDNTPRHRERAHVYAGAQPAFFAHYLARQIDRAVRLYRSEWLFINAWNEWAEGTYLEPDKKHGYAYLEAVRSALAANGY